ncbi:hypothetical protein NP493_321g04003, partial [Ridgeia piscesae]
PPTVTPGTTCRVDTDCGQHARFAKIPVNAACVATDICLDFNAECTRGSCSCKEGERGATEWTLHGLRQVPRLERGVCGRQMQLPRNALREECRLRVPQILLICCTNEQTVFPYEACCLFIKVGKIPLYYPCDVIDQCADSAAVCRPGQLRCLCKDKYHVTGGLCVPSIPLGDACSTKDVCSDQHASCRGGRCMCLKGYVARTGVCYRRLDIGDACTETHACAHLHAVCKHGRCQCADELYLKNNICEPRGSVNAPCLPSGKCVEANTVCETGVCRCAAGYFLKSRRVCVAKIPLEYPCDVTDRCADSHAACVGEICSCTTRYYVDGGVCSKFAPMRYIFVY